MHLEAIFFIIHMWCFHISIEWLFESWVTQTSRIQLRFLLKLLFLSHFLQLSCARLGCLKCTSAPLSKSVADFIESITLVFPVGLKTFCSARAVVLLDAVNLVSCHSWSPYHRLSTLPWPHMFIVTLRKPESGVFTQESGFLTQPFTLPEFHWEFKKRKNVIWNRNV